MKTLGVYTTLAVPPELDLPAAAYASKTAFGPGETPAAVVIGYGSRGQQQLLTVEVTESATGRSLLRKDVYASYRKVAMLPIPIRLGGDYTVRLLGDGRQWDTCGFTVVRANGAGQVAPVSAGARYSEGFVGISVKSQKNDRGAFEAYDTRFAYHMMLALSKDRSEKQAELFAQRFPGRVAIQCRLDSAGNLTALEIVANSLDYECGQALREALQKRSPYAAWPADLVQKFGSSSRDLTLVISFN